MNTILKAYKIQLSPNNKQITNMKKNCGAARWAFNYALSIKKEQFENKNKISNNIELHRQLNKLKGIEELIWGRDKVISKCSFQEALRDCDKAFSNFFMRCKKNVKGKKGFPKFKSKKNDKQSFRLYGSIKVSSNHIQLPNLGKIKICESTYIPSNANIKSATVSSRANKWFVSVLVEESVKEAKTPKNDIIGVDLGIKTLATCSDGTEYKNPKALKTNLKRLKRLQRNLSRKKKGSNNRNKARLKLAKLHFHISNIRKDCLHKVTTNIINENQVIVLENLKVSNMMKNHKIAQAISDVGFFEFKRQIEYKAKLNGRTVVMANTYFPSSKLCSSCGWKNDDLKLSHRVFECKKCNLKIDRDLNASLNLKQYYTGSSSEL